MSRRLGPPVACIIIRHIHATNQRNKNAQKQECREKQHGGSHENRRRVDTSATLFPVLFLFCSDRSLAGVSNFFFHNGMRHKWFVINRIVLPYMRYLPIHHGAHNGSDAVSAAASGAVVAALLRLQIQKRMFCQAKK